MKPLQHLFAIVFILGSSLPAFNVRAADEPAREPRDAAPVPVQAPAAPPENAELVKGLVMSGTLTKVIGCFSTFGRPEAGHAFELDLSNLPREKILFTRAPSDLAAHADPIASHIPFSTPLIIREVLRKARATKAGRPLAHPDRAVVNLSASKDGSRFLIQLMAERLEKGGKVNFILYQDSDGVFMGGMAEGEGVLK